MTGKHTTTDFRFAPIPEDVIYDKDLSPADVRVYGALIRHGMEPGSCYPSRERLARLCHMSVSTVKRSIASLADAGWVDRIERYGVDGSQTSNGYHIHTSPRGHQRPAPRVMDDPPPRSLVTHEREPENESHRTNTLSLSSDSRASRATTPAALLDEEFEDWYQGYPVKKSKGAARKAYRTARKKVDAETLLTARDAFVRLMEAQRVDKGYIKHPSTWLNGECWEDEIPEAPNPFAGPEMRYG